MIQDFSTRLSGLSPKKRALLRLALEKQGATFNAFPLSFAQQRVWFMEQLTPGTAAYTIPGAFRLTGRLDATLLARSINAIVQRHASLRTTFLTIDGQAIQTIAPALTIQVPLIDLQELPEHQREAAAQRLAVAEAEHVFDLARGPLIRASIVRLAQDEHILLINIHHIIFDLWSMGVFMAELAQLYTSLATDDDQATLPMPPLQYVDFAGWQRQWVEEQVLDRDLPYWQGQLADLPPSLDLPTDRPRPVSQSFRGASQPLRIDRDLAADLTALSQREGVTLFMTLLAAFNVLLYRYTGQSDLVVGSPIANRTRAEFTGLIGYFLNTLALRTDLAGNPSFREVVGRVREVALEAFAHSDLPFEILVEKLQPEHDGSRSPLFQALFILQPAQAVDQPIPGVTIAPLPLETTWSMVDLGLWISETGDGLTGSLSYSTDLFDAATIARMAEHFQVLLAGLVADPGRRILDVPILTEGEARQLRQWNRTEALYPQDASFAALFEAQVERSPDAIAVRWQDQQLSYAELNRQANQLAAVLIEQGVRRDVIVGLLAERSINFLVAVLAVFKAGGAYLPLDPQHPEQRWVQILSQSRTPLVLAASAFLPALSQAAAHLDAAPALLSIEDALGERREVENLPTRSTAADVAYVIYTSGSTGLPKGAVVEQRGMINHLYAKLADLALTEHDRVAQTASQCFDISVWQFLAALLVGGQEQIFPDAVSHDPAGLLG
ncbi:MAG TPA: condensation domain-containing protein, partial [Herpetosiphonaceae bacterium]